MAHNIERELCAGSERTESHAFAFTVFRRRFPKMSALGLAKGESQALARCVMSQVRLENKVSGYLCDSIALGQRSCFLDAEGQIIRHEMDLAI